MFGSREKKQLIPQDPAKTVRSPGERRQLQQLLDRGNQLQAAGNRDYANTVFAECVKRDPGNLIYVDAFLANLQAKFTKTKRSRFGSLRKGPLKKAQSRGDWRSVLAIGIEMLESNPWDVSALRALAHACEALDFGEVELRYLKNALDANPKDVDVNRHCGTSLARMGHFGQAIACWHRVAEAHPKDTEAQEMIAMLSTDTARQTITGIRGSVPHRYRAAKTAARQTADPSSVEETIENATTTSQPVDDEFEFFASPPETSKLQTLEQSLEVDPTEIANYFQLASLHASEGRFELAELVLGQASSVSPGDPHIRDAMEELAVYQMRQKLVIAERRAEQATDDQAQELADQIRSDVNRLELEVFAARCQRYPNRPDLNFQLGLRLKRAKKYHEAMAQFRAARDDPGQAPAAHLELGECLQHVQQFETAMKGYIQAAELAAQADDDPIMKLALYRAGVLATGMGYLELAVDRLEMIVELDPDYRDAGSRLDKLREIHDKE